MRFFALIGFIVIFAVFAFVFRFERGFDVAVVSVWADDHEEGEEDEDEENDYDYEDEEDDYEDEKDEDEEDDDVEKYIVAVSDVPTVPVTPATSQTLTQESDPVQAAGSVSIDDTEKVHVVTHDDGWKTESLVTVVDGVARVVETHYDAAGTVAHKVELVRGADGTETVTVTRYGADGAVIDFFDLETDDGKFVEYLNEQYGTRRHVMFDADGKWFVKMDNGQEYSIRAQEHDFLITAHGVSVTTTMPLQVDDATGVLSVVTDAAPVSVDVLPDVILSQAQELSRGGQDLAVQIVLHDNRVVYGATFVRPVRFLGIIPLSIPGALYFDVRSGKLIYQSTQNPLARFIDALSF